MYTTVEPVRDQRGLTLLPEPPTLLKLLGLLQLRASMDEGEYEPYPKERLLHTGQAALALAERCPFTGAVHLAIYDP